jgi:hypothetical protein
MVKEIPIHGEEVCTRLWQGNFKTSHHMQDLCVDGRIILNAS